MPNPQGNSIGKKEFKKAMQREEAVLLVEFHRLVLKRGEAVLESCTETGCRERTK